jgi:HAD superfamily hydrolase (TIGR01509 family)
MTSPIRAVLFDLDGTLIDTEPQAAQTLRRCFAGWNLALDERDSAYVTGRTWEAAFQYLFPRYRLPVPEADARQAILQAYREELARHLPAVPGSAECVRAVAKRYPLGLVSGSHRSEIQFALERLGVREHFRVVLGAEDYPRSKPAPDGYLRALGELGVAAAETLIFEDSEAGIASALAAGARVVAITGTNHFDQDLRGAHAEIPDLRGVDADWVERFGQK